MIRQGCDEKRRGFKQQERQEKEIEIDVTVNELIQKRFKTRKDIENSFTFRRSCSEISK